ncbi:MAG: hypothetical protein U0105_07150 [Candidatus Obscuribacterales bacterium]
MLDSSDEGAVVVAGGSLAGVSGAAAGGISMGGEAAGMSGAGAAVVSAPVRRYRLSAPWCPGRALAQPPVRLPVWRRALWRRLAEPLSVRFLPPVVVGLCSQK